VVIPKKPELNGVFDTPYQNIKWAFGAFPLLGFVGVKPIFLIWPKNFVSKARPNPGV
jgi:hypothetical protein